MASKHEKLVPFQEIIDHSAIRMAIWNAHLNAGAPGDFIGHDPGNRTYLCKLQYGEKRYRYHVSECCKKLKVVCDWSICGDRRRRQATVQINKSTGV